jgi:hypothetical protein
MKRRLAFCILIALFFITEGRSQSETNTQFWWDATYYRPFAVSYRKILSVGTQHLVSGGDPWNKLLVKPSLEWYPIPEIDVMSALTYVGTRQSSSRSTVEWRPDLGFRINFFQQRWTLRTNTRLEYRHIHTVETDENTNTWRFRARVEVIYPLTNPSHRDPKTLYGLTDFEIYADVAGDEVEERYANRNRFRLGLGWRQDLEWRVEFLYTRQNSKNTLVGDFENSDNIYRIRVKHQPKRNKAKKELKDQPHH